MAYPRRKLNSRLFKLIVQQLVKRKYLKEGLIFCRSVTAEEFLIGNQLRL